MQFPFNITRPPLVGGVQTQWKRRDDHQGCEGKGWHDYLKVPEDEVALSVKTWNQSQKWFSYRVKP
jgi:hypothetical protein